jgi:hypothetical protein
MTDNKFTGLCNGGPHHGQWIAHIRQHYHVESAPNLAYIFDGKDIKTQRFGTYIHKFGIWDWKPALSKNSKDSDR